MKGDMNLGKEGRLDGKLAVESPIDPLDDVAASARNYGEVKRHFRLAADILKTRAFTSESFLKLILNAELFESYSEL